MMQQDEDLGIISDNQRGSQSLDFDFEGVLHFVLSLEWPQISHCSLVVVSEDMHSLFDRMHQTALLLSTQRLVVAQVELQMLLGTIHNMGFKLCTGFDLFE